MRIKKLVLPKTLKVESFLALKKQLPTHIQMTKKQYKEYSNLFFTQPNTPHQPITFHGMKIIISK